MIDISIIIVSWNVKEELKKCLQSLVDNIGSHKCEIYIVDNNSKDETCSMVYENFPNVHLIENKSNVGFAKANNQAMLLCKGRYLLLLNPDTVVHSSAIKNMIEFMDSNLNAAACSCKILNESGEIFRFRTKDLAILDELMRDTIFAKLLSPFRERKEGIDYNQTQKVDRVPGTCMMVRKKIVEKIGMLDERYFLYVEDDDWCYRIKQVGDIFYVANATITHLHARSSAQVEESAWLIGTHSRFLFYKKFYGVALTIMLRGIILCSAVISFLKWKGIYMFDNYNKLANRKLLIYKTTIQACLGLTKRMT